MKIKPKKMLAGGFLLGSKVIRNVMKVIGKDNAKVIAAKKSISGKGSLDPVNLAQRNLKEQIFLVIPLKQLFQKIIKIKTKGLVRL
jgi:hypothetical protein